MTDIQIVEAANTNDPDNSAIQAFELYDEVYKGIEPFNVLIFPKTQDDFKPKETLLALHKNELLGVAVLKPVVEYGDNLALFGENALDILDTEFSISNFPVSRISNIAVLPRARGKGVAQKLYEFSAEASKGHCIAAITENNIASQKAASNAGYIDVPECHYESKLSFKENKPILDPNGLYTLKWFFMKFNPAVA